MEVPIFGHHYKDVAKLYPGVAERRLVHETVRRMINTLVLDLMTESAKRIKAAKPKRIEDVHAAGPLIAFSQKIADEAQTLKRFLRIELYQHYKVARMSAKAAALSPSCLGLPC